MCSQEDFTARVVLSKEIKQEKSPPKNKHNKEISKDFFFFYPSIRLERFVACCQRDFQLLERPKVQHGIGALIESAPCSATFGKSAREPSSKITPALMDVGKLKGNTAH